MTIDDIFDDEPRRDRESHTVRLAKKATNKGVKRSVILRMWLSRIVIITIATIAMIWYAIPAESKRQFPERIPVHVWHQWTGYRQPIVSDIIASFNASQDRYEVIELVVPTSVTEQKFLLATAGKDVPDIITQWRPVLSGWAADKLIQPLDQYLSPDELRILHEDMFPIARKASMYQGKFYAIVLGLNTFGIYYQPERLREVGYMTEGIPKSLEGLIALGKKFDRTDAQGNLTRVGFLPPSMPWMSALFGGGFRVDENSNITISTPENIRALTFLVEFYKQYGFNRVVQFRTSLNKGGLANEWPFVSGQVAMSLDGQWRIEQLAIYAPEVQYRTALLPPPEGGRHGAGFGAANLAFIPSGARQPEGAMEFLRYWSGLEQPHRAAKHIIRGGWVPMRKAVVNSPLYQQFMSENPEVRIFVTQMENPDLLPLPNVPWQAIFYEKLQLAEDRALRELVTPEEALQELEEQMQQERSRFERTHPAWSAR